MKYLPLIASNLLRRKTRTTFTLLSILVAFVLFGFLSAIRLAFSMGVDILGEDRLIVTHKVSLIQPLPISYGARLEAVEGVSDVTHATWFGGVYQDPKNFFAQMAVESESFLRLYTEFVVPEEQKEAWLGNRVGALAGRATAERYGWKIGDRIPIQGTIFRKADGGRTWEFVLEAIYDGAEKGVDDSQFFFHYEYLNESRTLGKDLVGWYTVRIDDPDRAPEIAEKIDALFANSRFETKTAGEKAFAQAFAKQVGDIGAILRGVLTAVFFTILLVAGNTMAQSVRERTGELAVLKTIGFTDLGVLALVLGESLLLSLLGGGAGLALGWLWTRSGDPTGGYLPVFYVPDSDLLVGVGFVLLLGIASGILPALRAMRLSIVDALRRT